MTPLTTDFETFYSDEFSLKKMPPLLYIRDPRFKVHGCAIKFGSDKSFWVTGRKLPDFFASIDWSQYEVVSHNGLFDMSILYEHYKIQPVRMVDTLGLCRALLPQDLGFDLETIAPLLKVGTKTKELILSKGLRDLPPAIEEKIAGYACNDDDLCFGIYEKLYPHLPEDERRLMHMTLRMGTQGHLLFDSSLGKDVREEVITNRDAKIAALGTTLEDLRSRDKFADMLRARGVEPPLKLNSKGVETYAFSKNDPAFVALQENPDVADLVSARMASTSNSAITRIENLIKISDLYPKTLPMPLNYYGAHTGRWSGAGKLNVQNLNARGSGKKLRQAIIAPPGYVIVVADSAGIELRGNLWFSGQRDKLDIIRKGGDVYKQAASDNFKIPVAQVTKDQRAFGKVITLGCGYQMGHEKFRATCAIGPMGNPPIYLSKLEAEEAVFNYRATNPWVVSSWHNLQYGAIPTLANGGRMERNGVVIEKGRIVLPNGMALLYPDVRPNSDEDGWVYGINGVTHKIYGGILQENIVQALARVIIGEQMLEADDLFTTYDGWVVSQTHDEIIGLCPTVHADTVLRDLIALMSVSPEWAPDLPLAAEGGYDTCYSK